MTHPTDALGFGDHWRIAIAHARQWTPFRRRYIHARAIVFEDHRIAYVPLPKCANSSIRAALLPMVGVTPDSVERIQEYRGFREIRLRELSGRPDIKDWYVFCVVRDPYSRFASAYVDKLMTRHEPLRPLRRMGLRTGDSFRRYMKMLEAWPLGATNEHFAAQSALLSEDGGRAGIRFFKLEEIGRGWMEISDEIERRSGIRLGGLERRNSSGTGLDWRTLYTPETRRIAEKLAAQDFTRFGYGREP